MKKVINLKQLLSFVLVMALLAFNPKEAKSCIEPDPATLITVTTNYSEDLTEIAIILGNLKFMEEEPNVFCSCALANYTGFWSHLEYVAFVYTGTNTPYPNMPVWESTEPVDAAWEGAYPSLGEWEGFISEVINDGLTPDDDVELVIRASTPPGYFVEVSGLDTLLLQSNLGTDAWDVVAGELVDDHQGVRNIGTDNSSKVFNEVSDDYFSNLDEGITSNTVEVISSLPFEVSPNPSKGAVTLKYSLEKATVVSVNLRDLSGRLVYSKPKEQQSDGNQQMILDVPEGMLPGGLYFVEILSEDRRGYQKLVIGN